MSIRRLFFFLLVATFFLVASGTPINSQNPSKKVIAGRNVNMVSGTQLPNGDPWLQRQNEPSIAASTRNPLHLLAGANDYRTIDIPGKVIDEIPGQEEKKTAQAPREPWLGVFKSFDGGQSWISTLLPGFPQDVSTEGLNSPLYQMGYHAAADPVVRAGTNGLFYFSGIAFNRDTMEGVVFVSRFIDNNNLEKNYEKDNCIKYLDTKIIDIGNVDQFLDKPWIVVDIPRDDSKKVTIDGQSIPQSNIYIAYSVFLGDSEENPHSKILLARSTDCGTTWSNPAILSESQHLNQGATIAVDPREDSSNVYVAWRRFKRKVGRKNERDAILIAKSADGGRKFKKASEVALFDPFDQGSSVATFRTNSYPTLAIDDSGRLYLAWSQRMGGPWGNARIVLSTSKDGKKWSKPEPIDDTGIGHQLMPSLTFAAGKLMMVWYDQRNDVSGRFTPFIDDVSGETRHTLDVRVAQAQPGKNPVFEPSKQVSRYLFVLTGNKPNYSVKQVQFNPVNYPLFKIGTWPFMGDYIDIAPSPMFVLDDSGHWRYNTEPSDSTIFHVAWTDNRDVRPPLDGKWDEYNPPNSIQEDPNFYTDKGCYFGDWTKSGMRNQNIYTSRITQGIVAGSFGNTKPLGTLGETPDGEKIPRTFVVFVKNSTDEIKSFRLTIANQPPGGRASFLEFDLLDWLDVKIPPHSSISRTVFVYSPEKYATVKINVAEIYEPNGDFIPNGLESSVILNPDIQNPDIQNPDIQNPDIQNPDIQNAEVHNPDIMNFYVNPDIMNPDIQNPDIMNPDIQNPDIMNPDIMNPDIQNPDIQNPDIMNPDIQNPDIQNPDIMNPDIMNTSITDPSAGRFTDVIWDLQNTGNTTSTFVFKTLSTAADEDGTLPDGIQAQLLIYRAYTTPAEHDTQGNPCALGKQEHQELILNIINPDIQNPDIQNIDLETPDIQNPDIMNATFSLEPEGVAKVILRLWKPYDYTQSTFRTLTTARTLSFNDSNSIMENFIGFTSGTSRNTTEQKAGIPTYASDSSIFLITTKILAPGEVGLGYSDFLTATGGETPYTSWSIVSGSLPAGLSLNSATGEISGTPTTAGTTSFTAQVMDTEGQTRTKDLWISISSPGITEYTITGRVTVGGSGLEGVAMNGLPGNPTTDSVGYYTTSVESPWSGTVTPAKAGYTFTPSSITYSNVTSNQTAQNYTATALIGPVDNFIVDAPATGTVGTPFIVTITAKDSAGNTTTNVSGATGLSVDGAGIITPTSIAEAEFADDGAWTGNVTLYEPGSRTITATNNGNIGSDTISIAAGAVAIIRIEDADDGTGTEVDTVTITPGGSFTVYAILRDSGNTFIENTSVTWDLINETGDAGDLIPAGDEKSATFTAHSGGTAKIAANYPLLYDETGTITVASSPSDDLYDLNGNNNDDFGSAALITPGTYTNLLLLDEDWYQIYVDAYKDLKVTITGVMENNIDLGLADSTGKYLVGGLSSSNEDTIHFNTTSSGYYYIRVPYTRGGGLQNTYRLTAEISDDLDLGHVSGTVTGATGTPPLQVRVRVYDRYSYRKWNTLTDATTGEYRISIPAGSYKIRFITTPILDYYGGINYLHEYSNDKPRFAEAPLIEVLAGASIQDIDGQLEQGGTITGTVRDLQGNIIEGALIRVRDLNGYSAPSAYSDEFGQYTVERLTTGYFKAYVRSWTENHGIEWYNDKPSFNESNAISVETGQITKGIDFQLIEGGNVQGRVTDVSGGGVGGISVVAYDPSIIMPYLYPSANIPQMGLRSTSTDSNGYYFMNHLPTGNVSLYFNTSNTNHVPEWYDDASKFQYSVPVPIQAGQTTSGINVVLAESGAVGGRVTNSSGDGIKDVLVWIFNIEGSGYYQKNVYTDDEGYYYIERIPVGNVKVRFRPNMYTNPYTGNWAVEWYGNKNSYAEAEEVPVIANETTWNVDAVLAANGGNIEGYVKNSGGQGIEGVYVSAYDSSIQAQVSYVYTDATGFYSVPRIPTCDVKLVFYTGNNQLPYVSEFYSDRSSYEYATPVSVWLSDTTYLPDVILSNRPVLTVTTTSLPNGDVGTPYSQTLAALGGTGSYHWSLAPSSNPLPDGLYLRSTGVIEGTPTSQGTFPFTVQVVDYSNPPQVAAQGLSITTGAYGGTDYIIRGTVTYGGSPLRGVVMDGLPGNPATNVLGNYLTIVPPGWSGTVTPALPGYFFDPPSRNYDNVSEHQENHDYSAFYGEPLRIITTSLPDGTKDASYSASLEVEAPNGIPPFEWSLIGSLPSGLILETSGEIHGTPSTAGDFIFTVQVTDNGSPQKSAAQYLTLYIAPHHQGFWTTTYPYGGNINSAGLVLDPLNPNVIYAAANWRGIYKSENAGSSWDNITDYLDLPFDRTDMRIFTIHQTTGTFYTVSHGEVYTSSDQGLSWERINNGISGYVQALTLHPTSSEILYAGTQGSGIFKTADGGAGWFNVSSGLPSDEIRSTAVDPNNPSTVYAGTLNNGIYKSIDAGMNWFSINNNIDLARIDNIVMDPSNTDIIYLAGNEPATGDGIFKSIDGGITWTKLPVNVSYSWPSGNYIAIDPSNTNIIYSISYQSIFKSVDGGSNWTESQITPHHVNTIVIDPSTVGNPATERTLYAGTDTEGVFKSTDSGQNWAAVNNGIRALNFPRSRSHSLAIDQYNPQIIYTGSINGGLKSTDKGQSWGSLDLNEWQAGTLATHATNPGVVYAFQHNLWKSTDFGDNWAQITGSGDVCCFGDGDFVIAPSNPSIFYLAGSWSGSTPNGIYKSTDSGSTWNLMNNGLTTENIRTLAVHLTNADIVFAGTMGDWPIDPTVDYGLFKTTDGGVNWSHVNCGLPEVLHINQIAIYPVDPNCMYMASEGENSGVYRSNDGGNCWWKIFNDNASSVAIDPGNPEIVYVGTWNSGGFYVTLNGGGTWTQLNDGLPLHPGIESIAIDPENPLHVFIGTTAGVYEATLNFDFTVTTEGLPEGVKDESYSVILKAMGGTEPYTWNVIEGALPTGLTMGGNGLISGIPTAPGTFHFRVQVADDDESSQQFYTKIFNITILNTYTLTTTVNPGAGGSLSRNPDKPKYIQGEFVDLTITPGAVYTFTGWSGDASGTTNPIHVQMTRDKNITANLALTAGLPDYYVDSLTAPSQADAGEIIGSSLNLVVGNQGAHDLYPGYIYVAVYLSTDPVITTEDILLWKGQSSIPALVGGTTIGINNLDLQIPTTVSEGDYHIGALVDISKAVAEQNEDNNYSSLPISITSTEYGYFDIVGYWDGGSTYGIAVDEARNLALIGHGGALEILDISNPFNPVKRGKLHLSSSLVVTIVTSGDLAYIANGAAGLKVVNFSDADNPVEIGSCDTFESGARSLDISGNYAYVTDYHHGLRVIDISTPTSPTEIAFLPLPYLSREIKVFGDYAYVTVRGHLAGGEGAPALRIIDVSQPADPTLRSTYGFRVNVGIPAIDITGDYLFVPTAGDGLRILDVSNPDLPYEYSFYEGAPNPSEVTIRGDHAFLDDPANSRVVILNISNVLYPDEISSYWFENQQALYGFEVAGNLWFVNRWYDSVKILDISDIYSPYEVGSYNETQGLHYFLDIADDHAFIINYKSRIDRLKVLDISNLSDITETATHETPYNIYGIDISGNHAYIPTFGDGLRVADITDPLNPEDAGSYEDLERARYVVVSGNYAYVADGGDGLRIFDISTPSNPILVSTWQHPGYAFSLSVSGNYVYIAGFRGGLRIIDVSDPLNPWEVGSLEFQGRRIRRVAVSENYAYITDEYKTLRVINVSDPGNPTEVSSFDTYYPVNLTISGNLLFVSDWLLGLRVMDISDPTHPTQIALLNELANAEQVVIQDNYIYALNRDSGFYVLEYKLPGPDQTIYTLSGTLMHSGDPISESTSTDQVIFHGWDFTRQQSWPTSPPEYDNTTGTFTIPDMETGQYYLDAYVDAEPTRGKWFPGDYHGAANNIVVSEGDYSVTTDIDLTFFMHLTSPFDNSNSYGYVPGEPLPQPYGPFRTHTSTILFKCDPVPGADSYIFSVWKFFTDGSPSEYVDSISTVNNEHTFILPVSGANDYYHFGLSVRANNNNIAVVMTAYDNGYGGGYLFRVVASPPPVSTPDPPSGPNSSNLDR